MMSGGPGSPAALTAPAAKGSVGPGTARRASAAPEVTLSTPALLGGAEQMCGFPPQRSIQGCFPTHR